MQHCDHCGQDFYSDTEFRDHQQWVALQESAKNSGKLWGNIECSINILSINLIVGREGCTFSEAAKKFFEQRLEYNRAVYKFNSIVGKEWENMQAEEQAKQREG